MSQFISPAKNSFNVTFLSDILFKMYIRSENLPIKQKLFFDKILTILYTSLISAKILYVIKMK